MNNKYEPVLSCDLCGGCQTKLIDNKGHIVQCKSCGLRFVNPRPRQKKISQLYDCYRLNCPGWGKIKQEQQLMHKRRFNFLSQFLQGEKILDVGSGLGEFLSYAQQTKRWQCFGTEVSRYAVEFVKKEFGITLSLGQLPDLRYPDKYFDAVTFWHVLEHLPYPSKIIKEVRRILKDQGYLFIAVPNDSWLGRRHFLKNALRQAINRLPLANRLKLKKMYPEIDEQGNKHLFYFTPSTLSKLLKKCGFRIAASSVDYDYESSEPKIERRYKFALLFCQWTGINISNAILVAAQKKG